MPDGADTQLDLPGPTPGPVEPPAVRSAGARAHLTAGDRVRFALRGLGQTLITAGLVVLLFVVYEVWITNLFAQARQDKVHTALEQAWQDGIDPLALPSGNQSGIPIGEGIANIYIPRLGRDYHFTIVQGTDDSALAKGPGHYVNTVLPGQVGNFGVAGHRVGKGEPFLNLDHLRPGDAVVIQTKTEWFVYRVLGDPAKGEAGLAYVDKNGVPGREIVDPSAGRVLLPIPNQPTANPSDPKFAPDNHYLTMTTCHPKFTASQRMIVHAELDSTMTTASTGPSQMPASIQALYNAPGL